MKIVHLKSLRLCLVIALLAFILDSGRFLEAPKAVVHAIASPGQYLLYSVWGNVRDWSSFLTFWRSGEARIKNLEQRVLELSTARNRADALERENGQLRRQLGVTVFANHKQLPAIVLGVSRYLEIGAGSDQGVAVGESVVYGDNLVGKVVVVSGPISFVQLPSDPDSVIAVRIGVARGLLKGNFGVSLKLSQVVQNAEIRTGDLVFTSGEGGIYQAGIVVGKIGKVTSDTTGLFKEAEVLPLIDYNKLTTVFVILS